MLDTRLTKVLEGTIIEFNEWALKKPFTQKFSESDIKGVFTEKLKRNIKVCNYTPGDIFKPELIHTLSVEDGIMTDLKFYRMIRSYQSQNYINFLDDCEEALSKISLKEISKTTPQKPESIINNTIESLKQLKF